MRKEIFEHLRWVIENREEYIHRWRRRTHRPVVAYTCSYVPEELIWAQGSLGIRLFPVPPPTYRADGLLQPYCCLCGKGILEVLLRGGMDIDGVIFSNTCDTMQRISDLYRVSCKNGPWCRDLMVPCRVEGEVPLSYFTQVLTESFELEEDALYEALSLYNRSRELIREINNRRIQGTLEISAYEMHLLYISGMTMAPDEWVEILEEIRGMPGGGKRARQGPGIIVVGSIYLCPHLAVMAEDAGAQVLYMDLCSGMRPYERRVELEGEPVEEIARSLLGRAICAAKYRNIQGRIAHIKRICKDLSPDGVVFLLPKFCDPHCFDYPDLALGLEGLPVLLLEVEDPWRFSAQHRTRLEAFIEML